VEELKFVKNEIKMLGVVMEEFLHDLEKLTDIVKTQQQNNQTPLQHRQRKFHFCQHHTTHNPPQHHTTHNLHQHHPFRTQQIGTSHLTNQTHT